MRNLCLAVLFLTVHARAADLHVPGDWPSIQSAVDHAQSGDTILVGPGTWVGPVQVIDKILVIVGVNGAGITTLNGGSSAYALILSSGSLVEGLTITGGSSARVLLPAGNSELHRCRVIDGIGPGVLVSGVGGRLIQDCLVRGNLGGGVRSPMTASEQGAKVLRCAIEHNGSPDLDFGGGVCGAGLSVEDCVVSGNMAQHGGGGAQLFSAPGTTFIGNTATISGGAYYAKGLGTTMSGTLAYADFVNNHASYCGGIHFDLPAGLQPGYTMQRCLVAGNTDDAGNLGLVSQPHAASGPNVTTVYRSTFVNNGVVGDQSLVVNLSIVRGAVPPLATGGTAVVQYSDIGGGWPGLGNFDADPLFIDAAHFVDVLTPGSPCVDAGMPGGGSDPDGSALDVGFASLSRFVGVPQAKRFGLLGLPALTATGSLQPLTTVTLALERARPLAGAILVLGIQGAFAPFKGSVLVPTPLVVIAGLPIDQDGELILGTTWPANLPSGLVAWAQYWIPDDAADQGLAASNGLGFIAP
jgi:hypothetical protein